MFKTHFQAPSLFKVNTATSRMLRILLEYISFFSKLSTAQSRKKASLFLIYRSPFETTHETRLILPENFLIKADVVGLYSSITHNGNWEVLQKQNNKFNKRVAAKLVFTCIFQPNPNCFGRFKTCVEKKFLTKETRVSFPGCISLSGRVNLLTAGWHYTFCRYIYSTFNDINNIYDNSNAWDISDTKPLQCNSLNLIQLF